MKNLLQTLLVFVLLVSGACTKLDLKPLDKTTPDVLFQDESAYRSFIAKVYAGLAVTGQSGPAGSSDITSLDEGFSNYLRVYWKLQELTTDEAIIAWGDEGIQDLHNHTWTASNQFVRATYYRIYFQVSQANEFLKETSDAKLDERGVSAATRADIVSYRAEARFLRALSYWHAIDLFGSVPFYTEEAGIGSEAPAQASRAEVFNFIDRELADIEGDLPAPRQGQYGRADQAAVWMLQANLYLNAQVYTGTARYNDCLTAVNKVIGSGAYTLQDNWRDLFKADNDQSQELIFAIPFDGQSTQTYGGTTFLVHAPVGGTMDPAVYGINGGWSGLRTTAALVDQFPDVSGAIDERANFYTSGQTKEIPLNGISNFNNGYAVQKFTNVTSTGDAGSDVNYPDTDFPMFRLGEAYLIYAEAVLRGGSGGDAGTALDYVNQLRARAYNGASGNLTADQLTLDFILDERARELYWEAHRRTDLVRFDQFTENGIWPYKGGVPEGTTTPAFRNLFPFPSSELLSNPRLNQNDGY